jgi:hypothetical protein
MNPVKDELHERRSQVIRSPAREKEVRETRIYQEEILPDVEDSKIECIVSSDNIQEHLVLLFAM